METKETQVKNTKPKKHLTFEEFFEENKEKSFNEMVIEESLRELSRHHWDFFVTLNFNYPVNKLDANIIVSRFIKKLNIAAFGSRSKKAVNIVVALEKNSLKGVHVHFLIVDPTPWVNPSRRARFNLKESIRHCWQDTHRATANVLRSCPDDESWFQEITEQRNAIGYMLKQIRSGNTDVIQWDIGNTSGRRNLP